MSAMPPKADSQGKYAKGPVLTQCMDRPCVARRIFEIAVLVMR